MLEINIGRVRELKGAPLAVLALLALAPRPVSKAWLERSSGYSDKPVKAACDYLQEQGLIDHSHSGWRLAAESHEPPEEDQLEVEDDQYVESETRNNSDPQDDFDDRSKSRPRNNSADVGFSNIWSQPLLRKNSGSRGAFMTSNDPGTRNNSAELGFSQLWSQPQTRKNPAAPGSLKILSLKDLKELKDLKDFKDFNTTSTTGTNLKNHRPAARRSNPEIPKKGSSGKSSQIKAEIWAELSRLGLRKNARTEALAELEHVTPAYVRALAEKLQEQGRGGYRHTGLFVRACEQAEAIQPAADPRQRGRAVQEAVDRFMNRGC